jgi:hypothetical protein
MIFSPTEHRAKYHALGLAGEVGEVCNKLKKVYRGDFSLIDADLVCELGGVMWYAAALANDLEVDLEEPKWIDRPSPMDCGLEMASSAGAISFFIDESKIDIILDNLIHIAQYMAALGWHLGIRREFILKSNLELIEDRRARGTVHGTGDHR